MITYRIGDAANPRPPAVIAHVVNDIGFFGAGFSGAIERRHPWAALHYRAWCAAKLGAPYCARGQCLISLHDSIAVAHLCAMNGVRRQGHTRPLVLASLDAALAELAVRMPFLEGFALVMPRIGCGLAGGAWYEVEPLVERHLGTFDPTVYSVE